MRTYGSVWPRIVDAQNLAAAWRRVRRNHARSCEVVLFERNLSGNLERLRQDLISGGYAPAGYRQFKIWDPKPRVISCAPVRDRVVHHALCGQIAPLLERGFLETSYACREGKGMHRACVKVQELLRRNAYYLKMDIHHFFDGIAHDTLKQVVCAHFRERPLRRLIEVIVDTYSCREGVGLPIGNLTSQWFANDYLNELDHWVAETLRLPFIRYMDDMVVFGDKSTCWHAHDEIGRYLRERRFLALKETATRVAPASDGLPFLGLLIHPRCLRLQNARLRRTRRRQKVRERQFLAGEISARQLVASVRAMDGCVRWFGMRNVLKRTQDHLILDTEERAASGSNRNNRGGSWNNDADNATSSYRNNNDPSNTNNNLGFRLFSTTIKASMSNSVQPAPDGLVRTNNAGSLPSSRRESAQGRQLLFHFKGDKS